LIRNQIPLYLYLLLLIGGSLRFGDVSIIIKVYKLQNLGPLNNCWVRVRVRVRVRKPTLKASKETDQADIKMKIMNSSK